MPRTPESPWDSPPLGAGGARLGVVSPTEETLREHNEELAANDTHGAAAAAAAVLSRLPFAAGSDWCESEGVANPGWAPPQMASLSGPAY